MVQCIMAYSRIKCPKCEQSFGQEVRFFKHVTDVHGVTDHLQLYLEMEHDGVHPTCMCSPECDQKLKWSGWKKGFTSKYVRGHNARIDSIFNDDEMQKKMRDKRIEGYETGRLTVWNAGLSKKTDHRILETSAKISKSLQQYHQKEGTVEWHRRDPEKAREAAKKSSETKKRKFANGEVTAWNKGLTKHGNAKLAAISEKISHTVKTNVYSSSKRFKADELTKIISEASSEIFEFLTDPNDYRNKYQYMSFKCKTCGAIQQKNLMMLLNTPVCHVCHPKESKAQLEIYDFVKSLAPDAVLSDRTRIAPKELDIYVPSRELGIEFNGLYYHSAHFMNAKYHQEKLNACNKAGVDLIMIYEDEWRDRREIIEGMIRHRLGKQPNTYDARKLTIRELTLDEAKRFFNENHLEGYTRCTKTFGLVDDTGNTVCAAMSLRRPFHAKYADWYELGRSCAKRDANVRGWLGKLSKAILADALASNKKGVMTYVDSRVGPGGGYKAAGWTLAAESSGARFWWTDYVHRYNRFKYKADKARGMTQRQVADEAGVIEIYGCSNSRWELT